jgi:hypothetical protein
LFIGCVSAARNKEEINKGGKLKRKKLNDKSTGR